MFLIGPLVKTLTICIAEFIQMKRSMPDWLWEKLQEIPAPSYPFESVRYHPVSARTDDGEIHPCTVIFGQNAYLKMGGQFSKGRTFIDINSVVDVFPSVYQLPINIANRIYDFVETRMGGYDFALTMRDGLVFYYSLGNRVDFINYPPSYGQSDIVDVEVGFVPEKHHFDKANVLQGPPYVWCLYDEPADVALSLRYEEQKI